MNKKIKPAVGIHQNVPHWEYLAWDALSNSGLREFRRSPAHYLASTKKERKQTEAMVLGTLAHLMVFEPKEVFKQFAVLPELDLRTTKGKDLKAKVEADNPGKTLIKKTDFDAATEAARQVVTHPKLVPLLPHVDTEVSFVWDENGVHCKGRADAIHMERGIILDLKTTQSAAFDEFSRTIATSGYHYQGAWYRHGLRKLGVGVDYFTLIAVEKEPPYGVQVFELDEALMDKAMHKISGYLEQYKKCLETGKWPCYPTDVAVIGIPTWAEKDLENMEAA